MKYGVNLASVGRNIITAAKAITATMIRPTRSLGDTAVFL